jgi:NAD(P)-dependent dehydrogenase (short-subunit alcohol dehydrogenase family)
MAMNRQIDGKVVVITGVSSGIGKATALAFARCGAHLALCARRGRQLEETANACRAEGANTVSMITDVSDEQQVGTLAARAIETFGKIDVWINNAAVDAFGSFEDIPTRSFERVIQINLLGTVYGAKAALPHFRERGSGILINNASMVGACPTPFHAAYVATKFAIRGLSHCLRQELVDLPDIHVCTISPASIDTPLWQRAANYTGRKIKPLDPVHPPELVADVMLDLVRNPETEVFAGATGWMIAEQHAAAPELTESMMAAFTRQSLFLNEPAEPTDGVLFQPEDGNGGASGGWLSPNSPGIPASDLMSLIAAPGLLAAAPPLYGLQLSYSFVQQLGRQFASATQQVPMMAAGWRRL